MYHGNSNQKKAKVAILISDRVGFIANKTTTDKIGSLKLPQAIVCIAKIEC